MARTETLQLEVELSNGKKAGNNLKDLGKEARALNKDIRALTPGSEEFIQKSKDLGKVKIAMSDINDEIKNAEESQKSLTDQFLGFIPFGDNIKGMVSTFQNWKGGIGSATKAFGGLKAGIAATGIGLLLLAIPALIAFFSKFQTGIDFVSETMAGFGAVINELIGRVANFGKGLWQILNGDFAAGAETLSKSFDNLGESIVNAFEEGRSIERARKELERFTRATAVAQASLSALAEENRAIADDDTRSFNERNKAAALARKQSEDFAKTELDLSNQRLALIEREIALIGNQEQITDDIRQKRADAQIEQIEAAKELRQVELDNTQFINKLKQDTLEKDLDILIDGFANVQAINTKIVQDTEQTFEKRADTLEELNRLGNVSFNEQVKTLQKLTKVNIDENDLIATSDSKLLNAKIRALELSEIGETRLLEVIRDRRTAVSDLAELETNLAKEKLDAEIAAANAIDELRNSLIEDDATRQIVALQNKLERELISNQDLFDKGIINREQFLEKERLLEIQFKRETDEILFENNKKRREDELAEILLAIDLSEQEKANLIAEKMLEAVEADDEFKLRQIESQLEFEQLRLQALIDSGLSTDLEIAQQNARILALQKSKNDELLAQEAAKEAKKKAISDASLAAAQNLSGLFDDLEEAGLTKSAGIIAAQKAIAISTIGINLGREIQAYFAQAAQLGPVAGPILAGIQSGIAVGRSAVQIRKITATKEQFSLGGVSKGPSHQAGGIEMINNQTGRSVGQLEGDEPILTAGVYRNPVLRAYASEINVLGGGRSFALGGPINPLSSGTQQVNINSGSQKTSQDSAQDIANLNAQSNALILEAINNQTQVIAAWPLKLKVVNDPRETDDALQVVNDIQESVNV